GVDVAPLAFDEEDRRPLLHDDEVHLAPVRVAEVAELDIAPAGVLLEVDPLEQMRGDEVLEPRTGLGNQRPVEVIMLLLLLDGTDPGAAERRKPKDRVQPLQDRKPPRGGLVTHAEVFPQVVDRSRRHAELWQAEHHWLRPAELLHALEAGDLLAQQEVAVLA